MNFGDETQSSQSYRLREPKGKYECSLIVQVHISGPEVDDSGLEKSTLERNSCSLVR